MYSVVGWFVMYSGCDVFCGWLVYNVFWRSLVKVFLKRLLWSLLLSFVGFFAPPTNISERIKRTYTDKNSQRFGNDLLVSINKINDYLKKTHCTVKVM